jgi:hypothetical protein
MMMQALGAMMRGESPKTFLKNLANTNPQLQGLNLDNLEGTARDLCNQRNVDMNSLKTQIEEFANSNKS